ncbi:orotate phosphoribosyltransferase-like protein [Methanocrinis sp.]|uniref:orotate phosphoribosyltransferase-like protein n=1 Tax=Methanocrinis sp. TaxID=3101522 RepID=UPI003D0CE1F7
MKNIDSLIEKASELKAEGLVEGQIAEELNISRETVTWLLTHGEKKAGVQGPKDVSVDWSSIGKSSIRLRQVSLALTDMIEECLDCTDAGVEVVVGIALSGVPLASMVAEVLGAELAVYTPTKQRWSTEKGETEFRGIFSTNFSDVCDAECVVVDDVITSGRTLEEAVEELNDHGASTNAIGVLLDKKGIDEIVGVPVCSLLQIMRVN